jgi:hypothetical protein
MDNPRPTRAFCPYCGERLTVKVLAPNEYWTVGETHAVAGGRRLCHDGGITQRFLPSLEGTAGFARDASSACRLNERHPGFSLPFSRHAAGRE